MNAVVYLFYLLSFPGDVGRETLGQGDEIIFFKFIQKIISKWQSWNPSPDWPDAKRLLLFLLHAAPSTTFKVTLCIRQKKTGTGA